MRASRSLMITLGLALGLGLLLSPAFGPEAALAHRDPSEQGPRHPIHRHGKSHVRAHRHRSVRHRARHTAAHRKARVRVLQAPPVRLRPVGAPAGQVLLVYPDHLEVARPPATASVGTIRLSGAAGALLYARGAGVLVVQVPSRSSLLVYDLTDVQPSVPPAPPPGLRAANHPMRHGRGSRPGHSAEHRRAARHRHLAVHPTVHATGANRPGATVASKRPAAPATFPLLAGYASPEFAEQGLRAWEIGGRVVLVAGTRAIATLDERTLMLSLDERARIGLPALVPEGKVLDAPDVGRLYRLEDGELSFEPTRPGQPPWPVPVPLPDPARAMALLGNDLVVVASSPEAGDPTTRVVDLAADTLDVRREATLSEPVEALGGRPGTVYLVDARARRVILLDAGAWRVSGTWSPPHPAGLTTMVPL